MQDRFAIGAMTLAAIMPWLAFQGPFWAIVVGQILLLVAVGLAAWTLAPKARQDRTWRLPLTGLGIAAVPVLAAWSINDTDLGRCSHLGVFPDAFGDAVAAFIESWPYAGLVGAVLGMAVPLAMQSKTRRQAAWTAGTGVFAVAMVYAAFLLSACD